MATANEIEIRVTVDDRTKAPFKRIETQLKQAGDKAGAEGGKAAGSSFAREFSKGFGKLNNGRRGFPGLFGGSAMQGAKGFGTVLTGTFGLIKTAVANIGTAMTGLMTGVMGVGQAFATVFMNMGSQLSNVAGGLGAVATSVFTLGAALALVGTIAGPALIAITSLAAAIGGGLAVALGAGVAALGFFSQTARDAFTGLGDFVQAEMAKLADSSGLSGALVKLAGTFKTAFTELRDEISAMMAAAIPAVEQLGGGFVDLAENLIPRVTTALKGMGPAFEGFKTLLGDIGTAIGDMFLKLSEHSAGFKEFFGGVGAVLKEVLPALGEFAGIVAAELGPALRDMAPHLAAFVRDMGPVLAQAIKDLAPHMPGLIQGFKDIAAAIIPMLTPLTEMAVRLLPSLALAFESLGPVIEFVSGLFTNVLLPVFDTVIAFVGMFVASLKAGWLAMQGDFDGAMRVMEEATVRFHQTLGAESQAAGQEFDANLRAGVQNATEGVMTGTQNILSGILGFQGRFESGGAALGEAFKRGIINQINEAVAAVQAGVERIAGLFGNSPAKWGPFSGRGYALYRGQRLMEAFAHGIRKGGAKLRTSGLDAMGNAEFAVFGHKHRRGRDWGRLASGSIKVPGMGPYAGAGAPSASMLAEHHQRQKRLPYQALKNGTAQITVTGDADGAIATMIQKLIRTGKLRIA